MSDLDKLAQRFSGQYHSIGASNVDSQITRTLRRFEVSQRIDAQANAAGLVAVNTNVAERLFYRVPVAAKVIEAFYTPDAANYAANTTNVRTIALRKRAGSAFGDTAATVASLGLGTNSLTQWVPSTLTTVAAQVECAANTILSAQVVCNHAESPVFPAGVLTVTFEEM